MDQQGLYGSPFFPVSKFRDDVPAATFQERAPVNAAILCTRGSVSIGDLAEKRPSRFAHRFDGPFYDNLRAYQINMRCSLECDDQPIKL